MRHVAILWALAAILCGSGIALADSTLTLKATVGYDGYYRTHTLVPVTVQIENAGDDIHGEFRIYSDVEGALPHMYRFPAYIAGRSKQVRFFYVIPEQFTKEVKVEFWSKQQKAAATSFHRCQEVYEQDRLMVVVGGTGSSLNYVNGQSISTTEYPMPRPWDFSGWAQRQIRGYQKPPGTASGSSGTARVISISSKMLPDNPEAYGTISVLALMSDVTENTLPQAVQQALPIWVNSGGHLLLAGGGVASRWNAPFFARLLPLRHGKPIAGAELLTNADGQTAVTASVGTGRVTALQYDPDNTTLGDWTKASKFYGKLAARDPQPPVMLQLRDAINQSIMVRNLRPPNLALIVVYLLVYLVLLVPVNYFVLKKLDKREFSWVTTPAIVLVFTLGAYGIGSITKGHRLVLNMLSVIETGAGQTAAEANSELLIFSPSHTNYRMTLGNTGLMAREVSMDSNTYNSYNAYQEERQLGHLTYTVEDNKIQIDRINVNMWDFRQFVMAHTVDLGKGITAQLRAGQPASTPRATGTVTNNTPYRFALCELYLDGAFVSSFTMAPGETVTVQKFAGANLTPKFNEDEQHMFDTLRPQVKSLFSANGALMKGAVLLAYSTDSKLRVPMRIDNRGASTAMTLMVVHLPAE